MKNAIAISIAISAVLSLTGCFDENQKAPAENSNSCSSESISSIKDKKLREEQSAKCMSSGTYSMSEPETF